MGYILLVILGRKGIIGSFIQNFFSYKLLFSKSAAIIVFVTVSFPILYQNIKNALTSIDKSCLEAARVMGATEAKVFYYIVLPLAKKGILAGMILGFGRGFGEFGASIMVAGNIPGKTQTIPLAIYSLSEAGKDNEAVVLVTFVLFFSSLLFFIYSKLIEKK
jgi:molybdate transport system permease protein